MDFSLRPPHLHVEDICDESITISCVELWLALCNASMEVHEKVEELKTQLQQASQGHPKSSINRETLHEMNKLNKCLQTMQEQQQQPQSMTQLVHPNIIDVPTMENDGLPFPFPCVVWILHIAFVGACTTFPILYRAC